MTSNPLIFLFGICFGVILSVSIVAHMPQWLSYLRGDDHATHNVGNIAGDASARHHSHVRPDKLSESASHHIPPQLVPASVNSLPSPNNFQSSNLPSVNSNTMIQPQSHAIIPSTSISSTVLSSAPISSSDATSSHLSNLIQKIKARTRWSPGQDIINGNSNSNSNDNINSNNNSPVSASPAVTAGVGGLPPVVDSVASDPSTISSPPAAVLDGERNRRKRKERPALLISTGDGGGGSNFSTDDVIVTINNQQSMILYKEINNVITREAVPLNKVAELLKSQDSIGSDGVRYYTHPPWTPYHSQSYVKPLSPPYIPSLNSVKSYRENLKSLVKDSSDLANTNVLRAYSDRAMPNMADQKADYEGEDLKFHLCNGVFEAYSASYVTTREHMLEVKSEKYNLSFVNCEMASFIHMRESANFFKNKYGKGLIMQTLDVLDLSVIHLSAFERSSLKHKFKLWRGKKDLETAWKNIDEVKETARLLEAKINPEKTGIPLQWTEEAKRTVVVMPFLGGAMGAGHSVLGNRFEYLKACFWSFYEFVPNIVIGVSRKEDVHWGFFESGLPFFDILLLEGLPKGASLPVGTTQYVKRLFQSGNKSWSQFDYVFFSESDQILISRQLPLVHHHLKLYPSHMVLPHRLMPYSGRVIQEVHNKSKKDLKYNEWMYQSCCLPRQNCQERKSWHPLAHEHVPVINYYGLYVPLGNVNFLDEKYRACEMMSYIPDYCP